MIQQINTYSERQYHLLHYKVSMYAHVLTSRRILSNCPGPIKRWFTQGRDDGTIQYTTRQTIKLNHFTRCILYRLMNWSWLFLANQFHWVVSLTSKHWLLVDAKPLHESIIAHFTYAYLLLSFSPKTRVMDKTFFRGDSREKCCASAESTKGWNFNQDWYERSLPEF